MEKECLLAQRYWLLELQTVSNLQKKLRVYQKLANPPGTKAQLRCPLTYQREPGLQVLPAALSSYHFQGPAGWHILFPTLNFQLGFPPSGSSGFYITQPFGLCQSLGPSCPLLAGGLYSVSTCEGNLASAFLAKFCIYSTEMAFSKPLKKPGDSAYTFLAGERTNQYPSTWFEISFSPKDTVFSHWGLILKILAIVVFCPGWKEAYPGELRLSRLWAKMQWSWVEKIGLGGKQWIKQKRS